MARLRCGVDTAACTAIAALPLTHDFPAKMLGVRPGIEGISCNSRRLARAHYEELLDSAENGVTTGTERS